MNGRVRGMSGGGIAVDAANVRIEKRIVERNCADGISVGVAGLVIDAQARANAELGIVTGTGGRIRDSVVDDNDNKKNGIVVDAGSVVTGCVVTTNIGNGSNGMNLNGSGSVVLGNSALRNGISGITSSSPIIAIGLNAAVGNTSSGYAGFAISKIACNQDGASTVLCPP